MKPLPSLPDMLSELVRRPSVSSESAPFDMPNEPVISLLANWLEGLGFHCEVMAVPGRSGKYNLIAARGSGPGGLVLSGHADTVPCDDQGWSSDPFQLTERDGRYHGLGICDMKGFLGMAVHVAAEFRDAALKQPLIILATADEESGMDGARALVAAGRPQARYALIGEPTGLTPVRLHKGILMDGIRVLGHSGHSSRTDLGANAIEGMHQVLRALVAYREELKSRRSGGGAFVLDYPTLNLGCIHGGDSANRIPAQCELQVDLRMTPGQRVDDLRAELRERACNALTLPGCRVEFDTVFDGVPSFETPATSELVAACEKLTGHSAGAADFATEGPFLSRLGMDTVILGPGDIEVAHQPDEFLGLERIDPMLEVLRGLVRRFCL